MFTAFRQRFRTWLFRPKIDSGTGNSSVAGDEDFAGLRGYVAGDPLQRIAWKAPAREQGLQVKQFAAGLPGIGRNRGCMGIGT